MSGLRGTSGEPTSEWADMDESGMKLRVDQNNDVLYLRLDESAIVESEEVRPGVILDYDTNENVVGIEILGLSKRVSQDMLRNLQFETT